MIDQHNLTWEMVPAEMLQHKEVWKALSKRMPPTTLLWNLATLTRVGVIAPMESAWVCQKLINEISRSARIHPIAVLTTSELSLHRCPAVKARRMATPSNSGHSAHGS